MIPKKTIFLLIWSSVTLLIVPFYFETLVEGTGSDRKWTSGASHEVKSVYDGDSILLNSGEKVRYLDIDTPEIDHSGGKSQFMAHAARELNVKLVSNSRIRMEYNRKRLDRHGRVLAYVFLEDGRMVNAILLRRGLAHLMLKKPRFKYFSFLLRCQRQAMEKRIGIWSRNPQKREKVYLGNRNSYRFHRPSCPFGMNMRKESVVHFKTPHDAFWEGYSPCRRCMP
jgi:micrococcal nuclease